jgi:hypothetical protein
MSVYKRLALAISVVGATICIGSGTASAQTIWNGSAWVQVTTSQPCGGICFRVRLDAKSASQDVRAQHTCVASGQTNVGAWVGTPGTASTTPSCGPQDDYNLAIGVEW